jgi:hypothetical protein
VHFIENQVVRRSAQNRIRPFLILGKDKQPGSLQTRHQNITHLRSGFATGQPVYEYPLDREELSQSRILNCEWCRRTSLARQ